MTERWHTRLSRDKKRRKEEEEGRAAPLESGKSILQYVSNRKNRLNVLMTRYESMIDRRGPRVPRLIDQTASV